MENLFEAVMISVIGLVVVMIVLIGLTFILNSLKVLSKKEQPMAVKKEEAPPVVLKPVFTYKEEPQNNADIIAVITAAIAASLNTTEDRIFIRSIKKSSNWIEAAKSESLI